MKSAPTPAEIDNLFKNSDADEVWPRAAAICMLINPAYDSSFSKAAFDDVIRLFHGEYPGYCPIKTLYHNQAHTMDVLMCAVRLMHGVHLSGTHLSDRDMTMIMMAALMHDIGYAQLLGEDTGTGAQYTKSHVDRGIEFMRHYIVERRFPSDFATTLEFAMRCTDPSVTVSRIDFPDERTRLLGQIVRTADFTGQMADRTYLEKLLFLYLEFDEAHFGSYKSLNDLLHKTCDFYEITRQQLDGELSGMYAKLTFHFKDRFGVENNYYLESIEKNIAYLSKIISLNDAKYLAMLKRGGIVEKAKSLIHPDKIG